MRFTKMDRKLTVKRQGTERTDTGGIKSTGETTVFETWCHLTPKRGVRDTDYGQYRHTKPFDVYLANRTEEIKATDQIYIDGDKYQIIDTPFVSADRKYIQMEVER